MPFTIKVASLFVLIASTAMAQTTMPSQPQVIHLWANGAPGFESRRDVPEEAQSYWVRNINNPSLAVFLPPKEKATGAAIVVVPGGGHRELVFNAEGRDPAIFLSNLGIAAFALKYRLGREPGSPYTIDDARQDTVRAMRLVRSRAAEWNIDPNRVGILGFSAGGELVSMIAYNHDAPDPNAADPIERQSARPNFQLLIYPGPLGIPDVVPADAPPAFVLAANDDKGPSNTLLTLVERYRQAGVPIEFHLFAHGSHAFNMGDRSKLVTIHSWPDRMADWLRDNVINPPSQN
jgi:acetyl esterase/lipase